jgi:hypothetical protein
LTDDLEDEDPKNAQHVNQATPITRWGGHANPVPPQVRKEYWIRLYNRADSSLYGTVKKIVTNKPEDDDASGRRAGRGTGVSAGVGDGGGFSVTGGSGSGSADGGGEGAGDPPQGRQAASKGKIQDMRVILRDHGEIYDMAVELLIRDLVGADKMDGGGVKKRAALRETREL